jgi:four helix bundle protein
MASPLKARTRTFAMDVLRFVAQLPSTRIGDIVSDQLGRAGSSVGANYRRACRAQSRKDFVAKMKTVEEEADESGYWLDVCAELGLGEQTTTHRLAAEASEITAMVVASIRTTRENDRRFRNP